MKKGDELVFQGIKGTVESVQTMQSGKKVYGVMLDSNSYNLTKVHLKENDGDFEVLTMDEIAELTNRPDRMPK